MNKVVLSRLFYEVFKSVYDCLKDDSNLEIEFDEVFKDNESRLSFLNMIFDKIEQGQLSDEFKYVFNGSIVFLENFISGKIKDLDAFASSIEVPHVFAGDEQGIYVPYEHDLRLLFGLVKICSNMHEELYEGQKICIQMPNNTFNQQIIKMMEIKRQNLAHLLGFTENEKKGNLLFEYFKEIDKELYPALYDSSGRFLSNDQKYSERYLDWILSEDGQRQIIKLNKQVRDFMDRDMQIHPERYENGQLKNNKLDSIKKFKSDLFEETGIEFPIIKFSRYITKTINLLNFMNMTNTTEYISDYNKSDGVKIPEDFFFVNADSEKFIEWNKKYIEDKKNILSLIKEYVMADGIRKSEIEGELMKYDITIASDASKASSFFSMGNLAFTYDFVEKHGIVPKTYSQDDKICEKLSIRFPNDIHLVGFASKDDSEGKIVHDIGQGFIDNLYCGTSIAVAYPQFVDKFCKLGRLFFVNKISSEDGTIFNIATAREEAAFLDMMEVLYGDSFERSKGLLNELQIFEEKFSLYCLSNGVTFYSSAIEEFSSFFEKMNYHNQEIQALFRDYYGVPPLPEKEIDSMFNMDFKETFIEEKEKNDNKKIDDVQHNDEMAAFFADDASANKDNKNNVNSDSSTNK